jgi:hypothetical protein
MKPNLSAIFIFIFLPLFINGQSRWVRIYHEDEDVHATNMEIAYDGGCLLSGWMFDSRFNWLIKTDINGDILWEKIIGDLLTGLSIYSTSINSQGEVYIAGEADGFGSPSDPIIIKLNACGEKEWCRVISTESDYDGAIDICALDQGGCTFTLRNSTTNWDLDRVCMMNLDNDGDFIWKECYNGTDSNAFVLDHEDLLLTPDGGYLITGSCSYFTLPPNYNRTLTFLIKTDSLGLLQWDLPFEKDPPNLNRSNGYRSIQSPDGGYYYTSVRHWHGQGTYGDAPALVKVSLAGNELGFYDLAEPDSQGKLYESKFLNDSLLAAIALWGETGSDLKLILMNTQGEIQEEKIYLQGCYDGILRITSDDKIVILTNRSDDVSLTNAYLVKFNNQLIDDTLYLQPFRYDSLCPHPIPSDTIYLDDCGVIVDITEDYPGVNDQAMQVKAWPNPCRNEVTISFKMIDDPDRIDCYSVYGQHLYSQDIGKDENQLNINTGNFPPGIIVVVLRGLNNIVLVSKIVKL